MEALRLTPHRGTHFEQRMSTHRTIHICDRRHEVIGKLGDNSTVGSPRPVGVYNLPNAKVINTGRDHTCAVTTTQRVKC